MDKNGCLISSPTHGSRQASPTEAVERMGPSQMEMMGQQHPHPHSHPHQHLLHQQNPVQNKAPTEDFQNHEAQNMGGMEQQAGVESLQFDYAGNQIQVDSSGTPMGLFDYNSQQQVCGNTSSFQGSHMFWESSVLENNQTEQCHFKGSGSVLGITEGLS